MYNIFSLICYKLFSFDEDQNQNILIRGETDLQNKPSYFYVLLTQSTILLMLATLQ
jgi:hypothetical protein